MDDDIKNRKLFPGLSGNPKVRVSYGDKNLTKIIESLILLDIDEMLKYNRDTDIDK